MKTFALAIVLSLGISTLVLAAENTPTVPTVQQGDVQLVLDRLQGSSGLYGATPTEMNQFLGMVQTPEMTKIVERMHQQMVAQGLNVDTMDLQDVSAFVQQNLTRQDAEALLGQSVSPRDFQQGVQAGGDPDNLNSLLQMLSPK